MLSDRYIDAGGITLNIREAGTGPLVLFLHGITGNATAWDPVLCELRRSYRVVAVDQRGHGKSDKPAGGYSARDYARDVASLVEALGGEPSIVVGHSLGARNAIVAAADYPERVRGVVAIEFTPYLGSDVFDALEARVGSGNRLFESWQDVMSYLRKRYPRITEDAIERRARNGYRAVDGHYLPLADPDAIVQTARGLREDLEPATRAVRCPTLLIRGADSTLVSVDAFDKTLKLRPDFSHLVVEGADHYVTEEVPAAVSDAVRGFIASLT